VLRATRPPNMRRRLDASMHPRNASIHVSCFRSGAHLVSWLRLCFDSLGSRDCYVHPSQLDDPSILLLSVTDDPARLHPDFYAARRCYAHRQGVALKTIIRASNATNMPSAHFEKVVVLRESLPQVDWVLLSDSDTVVVGDWPLKEWLRNMSSAGVHLIFPKDGIRTWAFSNFAMIVRNSRIGWRFIDAWWEERWSKCGWFDQCACWRAILRVLWGSSYRALPEWNGTSWDSQRLFNDQMVAITGREKGSGTRWPNASEASDSVRVGPIVFSGAHFLQMKHVWLRFRLYCPLSRMTAAFQGAIIVHSESPSKGPPAVTAPLTFPGCHGQCPARCANKVQLRGDICDPRQVSLPSFWAEHAEQAANLTTLVF
jgi:hypothetical protein